MIERVSIMSTARDHSNIAPIFHPAESWHAENVRHFFAATAYSFPLLASGIGLRLAEYNLIENKAERNRYKQNTFLRNFVLNNPYKDSANMLLALWTLIISVIIVTAFLETKTPESSSKARAFNVFVCFLSCAISIFTGYISPDMLQQNDFGLSLLLIIVSLNIAAFALSYGVKQVFSFRMIQENEMLRSDHLNEYQSLAKGSLVKRHPRADAFLRITCGLILMTTLAAFITYEIAALFARMNNHPVSSIKTFIITAVSGLVPCLFDPLFMLDIGAGGHPSRKNLKYYKVRMTCKWIYRVFTVLSSWLISIFAFAIVSVLNPTTVPMYLDTLLAPIPIGVIYLLPCWNWFLAPIHKSWVCNLIKDDQRNIEQIHYEAFTKIAASYLSSELSVDTHREYLMHTVIIPAEKEEWAEICHPAFRTTNQVPLLSLSTQELQKTLESDNLKQKNDISPDATKRQRTIASLINKIDTNDQEFNCCDQEDCKIYLAAIFDDRQYLSTSISSEADNEERLQKVITHSFSSFKGRWQLILTLVRR
ncbi:hypothetical protein [Bifidobacterium apousia]|uniref:hypothetical protein n=1 Tax=Bifidobacterium apousia TaxID=2750996 RepID=UPI0018DCCFFB|nr:hypothetical protein [Bifidobacterium apousia]MBI0062997.1 hypothetical protein [Bifidobacterium apousia]